MKTPHHILIEFDDETMDLRGEEAEAWWRSHEGAMILQAIHSPGSMTPGFESHPKIEFKMFTNVGSDANTRTRTYSVGKWMK